MEKLICTACGAPLTPDTSSPFLTCEYCDTAIENKFYVAPPEPAEQPAAEPVIPEEAETDADEASASSGGSLLQALIGAGTAMVAGTMRAKRTTVQRPMIHTSSVGHAPLRNTHQRTLHAAPRRHPEPPRAGGMHARPARPGMAGRPGGMGGPGGRGPGGRGGMGGPGGRGGMGGPGGRHR